MTEKDIKDYCKNCDVEPPAMMYKCPECEHNPDNENNFVEDINVPRKEPIMVDGCNVSECLFYQSNFEEDYDVKIKHFCSNWHNSCESINNSNCYFKQLARKTQECERSRKRISDLEERIINHSNEIEEYCSRLADKNKKCEKYEQALTEIKEIAEPFCNACQEFEPEKKGSNCMYCNYGKILQKINILDIINKAKGEGNEDT